MANNFSKNEARKYLAQKTGFSSDEFMYSGISKNGQFTRHIFYRGTDRSILYTVLSPAEREHLEEECPTDFAP